MKNEIELLVAKCRKQDRRAQMRLYDKYAQAMFQTAFNFCKDDMLAQDLMQDAFIKAFKKIDSYNGEASFGAWLKKIVVHQSLDWLKKRKIETEDIDQHVYHLAEEQEDVEVEVNKKSMQQLYQAIDQLPRKCQNVTKLYLLEGYRHDEISEILDISEVASRSLLSRGKSKLKELVIKKVS